MLSSKEKSVSLVYSLGATADEQVQNLFELQHTFANSIIALGESFEDMNESAEFKHLKTLYYESHRMWHEMSH